ncbi:hypothetical protein RB195_013338 [Necator americanus]|uniref:Serine/threonine-protein phosphatase n=1 Tax=Necator americanus TaxID=51031 RepID=A0ABR1DWJ2_NECAM
MLYCLLFSTTVAASEVRGNTSCFDGKISSDGSVRTAEKEAKLWCSVMVSETHNLPLFEQRDCPSAGCHLYSTDDFYCCCDTHLCNTLSFFHLNRTRSYAKQYIGHFVILIIVIAKLLILLIINCGPPDPFDKNPRFEERIHLDLTQFSIQPKLNANETNYVIEQISRGTSEPTSASLENLAVNAVLTYSTTDRMTYREAKDQAKLTDINCSSPLGEILNSVIRLGPCEINWDYDVVGVILAAAYKTLMEEPTVLELSAPITIYGDIHGQYSDVWRWFHANGWPPDTRCLFLGDYVDRGRHSTEVLMFLLLLKIVLPKSVYLIRGNHEDPPVNKAYNFQSEVRTRFSRRLFKKLYRKIGKVFSAMPIACVINQQIMCFHGGLSPRINTIAEIAALRKPIVTNKRIDLHIDIMWSDPHVDVWGFGPNTFRDAAGVGVGYVFGPIQIRKFVKRNKLSLIVRGHQPPMSGYERIGKHLLTIFSTAGYRVKDDIGNMSASLVIGEDGEMNIVRIQIGEPLKLKRQRYKMEKGDRYRDCGKPKQKHSSTGDEYS